MRRPATLEALARAKAGEPNWCVTSKRLERAFRRALDSAPCSLRSLAREAGLAHSTLSRARSGDLAITPAIADAVVRALQAWSTECADLAAKLEAASDDARRARG